MRRIVWLLEDSLGACDAALRANPDAPAVFVFDDEWYRANPTSFKRVFFVYESAVETLADRDAPGDVRRGAVVREVLDFCHKYKAEEIHVTRSQSAAYRQHVDLLRANFVVVEHEPDRLVAWQGRPPRRFMDFWKKVSPQVLPEPEREPVSESSHDEE